MHYIDKGKDDAYLRDINYSNNHQFEKIVREWHKSKKNWYAFFIRNKNDYLINDKIQNTVIDNLLTYHYLFLGEKYKCYTLKTQIIDEDGFNLMINCKPFCVYKKVIE